MTTADDFRTARFATHPDGRIAARVDPASALPWSTGSSRRAHDWADDYNMAADGWSPLDESRLPRVVTDEFVDFVHEDYFWSTSDRVRLEKPALRHALNDAVKRSAAPTTDEDARTYALEQIEAAQAETTEAVTRAERAEQERDEAIREAEELGEALGNVRPMDTMTARDLLNAAWSAAHVPADGIIPAGAECIERFTEGAVYGPATYSHDLSAEPREGLTRRLVDPPTPARPEWADLAAVFDGLDVSALVDLDDLARQAHERGVRAPEEERDE